MTCDQVLFLVVQPLNKHETLGELIPIQDSDFFKNKGGFLMITTHRFILLTEDKQGGSYWPLNTTEYISKQGKLKFPIGYFVYFRSTIAGSKERWVQFKEKTTRGLVKSLFHTNKEFGEYKKEEDSYVQDRSDMLALFYEECERVDRFAAALNVCSENAYALFKWLIVMVGDDYE